MPKPIEAIMGLTFALFLCLIIIYGCKYLAFLVRRNRADKKEIAKSKIQETIDKGNRAIEQSHYTLEKGGTILKKGRTSC